MWASDKYSQPCNHRLASQNIYKIITENVYARPLYSPLSFLIVACGQEGLWVSINPQNNSLILILVYFIIIICYRLFN